MDDRLYDIYERTYVTFDAALRLNDEQRVRALLAEIMERPGCAGVVSLLAFTDASSSCILRSRIHLRRRVAELLDARA